MITHENILAVLIKKELVIAGLEQQVTLLQAEVTNKDKLIAELQRQLADEGAGPGV